MPNLSPHIDLVLNIIEILADYPHSVLVGIDSRQV